MRDLTRDTKRTQDEAVLQFWLEKYQARASKEISSWQGASSPGWVLLLPKRGLVLTRLEALMHFAPLRFFDGIS